MAMLAYVCLMLAHVEPKDPKNGNSKKTAVKHRIFDGRRPILGLCWPILSHKIRKMGKNWKSTKHRKTRQFLAVPGGLRLGRRPLSPMERREPPSAMLGPGGPWPDLSAYAQQPASNSRPGAQPWEPRRRI